MFCNISFLTLECFSPSAAKIIRNTTLICCLGAHAIDSCAAGLPDVCDQVSVVRCQACVALLPRLQALPPHASSSWIQKPESESGRRLTLNRRRAVRALLSYSRLPPDCDCCARVFVGHVGTCLLAAFPDPPACHCFTQLSLILSSVVHAPLFSHGHLVH
jgi:hypothetical protein